MSQFGITKEKAPYFIPPFEYYNSTVASWAKEMGLQIINYTPGTLSNNDYTYPNMIEGKYFSSKYLFDYMMGREKTHTLNGNFILMHMGTVPERTDKFYNWLDKIIKTLKSRGYQFVSVEDMLSLKMK